MRASKTRYCNEIVKALASAKLLVSSRARFSFFSSLVLRSSILIGIAQVLYLPFSLTTSVLIVRCGCRSVSRLGFSLSDTSTHMRIGPIILLS
ncbi:hypothetical protein BDR03DRAFT_523391 [Suillus americanus]|nr:hypothetical protein BDR03DRAFT_523391 [Suillus americanus]